MNKTWTDILAIASVIFTIVGFSIAIWQIIKTRRISLAAKEAAIDARNKIMSNVIISDVSTCIKIIEEIQTQVRSNRFEAALIRVSDLKSNLIQTRSLRNPQEEQPITHQESLSQLSILHEQLENKVYDSGYQINVVRINTVLSNIMDSLNSWIGKLKYLPEKKELKNDSRKLP